MATQGLQYNPGEQQQEAQAAMWKQHMTEADHSLDMMKRAQRVHDFQVKMWERKKDMEHKSVAQRRKIAAEMLKHEETLEKHNIRLKQIREATQNKPKKESK